MSDTETAEKMDKYEGEEVLVVTREFFEDLFAGEAGTMVKFTPSADGYLSELLVNSKYMLRCDAEKDANFKQLIPYCLVVYGDQLIHYSRSKSAAEARLGGKRSVGVGGHINPPTTGRAEGADDDTFRYSMLRELLEELGLKDHSIESMELIGFVNDEDNEVGTVHLGVIMLIVLNNPELGAIEEHLTDVRWNTPQEIYLESELETWSEQILRGLRETIEARPTALSDWRWSDHRK